MDLLSDVLGLMGSRSHLTAGLDAGGAWAIRFESGPGAVKCYALVEGSCWLRLDGEDADVRLTAGDCFVLPSGRPFMLASDLAAAPVRAEHLLGRAEPGEVVVHQGGGGALFAGTRFDVDARKAAMLLSALPPIVRLQAAEDRAALRWLIERMMAELRDPRPGAPLAAHNLAQLMLLQALRLHLAQQGGNRVGWFYALADPQLSRALKALHADPAHCWTVGELASCAGMSRSGFAQRFRERVGETPVAHFTRWRMLLAAERLASGVDPLATVAQELGYGSENAFSTAFSRVMGCAPRRYARAQARANEVEVEGRQSDCPRDHSARGSLGHWLPEQADIIRAPRGR